jgi:hypothetical protein
MSKIKEAGKKRGWVKTIAVVVVGGVVWLLSGGKVKPPTT